MSKNTLWVEKYRPKKLDDCVLPERIKKTIQGFIDKKELPNLLLTGIQGSGKTTLAKCLINELEAESLFIDASSDNGKGMIQESIIPFVSTISILNNEVPKVVLLDECLYEEETVEVGTIDNHRSVKLKDLPKNEYFPVVSVNLESKELCNDSAWLSVDKIDEVYEIELENGQKIIANGKHPFMISDNGNMIRKRVEDGLVGESVFVSEKTEMKTSKFISVKKLDKPMRVMDITTVSHNHTFITSGGIVSSNCDALTFPAQQSLRPNMELYSSTSRFIMTGNYAAKFIPALKSRCVHFDFSITKENKAELLMQFFKRASFILEENKVEYDKKVLATYIASVFPDYRKIINELQGYSSAYGRIDNGILSVNSNLISSDLYPLLKSKKFDEVRKWVLESTHSSDDVFRSLFTEMKLFVEPQKQPNLILILADYQFKSGQVANQSLNLLACCVEIMSEL